MTEPEPLRVVDRRRWAQATDTETDAPRTEESGGTSRKPGYVAELEKRLADKDVTLREATSKYEAALHELEHTGQRLQREKGKDIERATRQILATFLEVVDNLDRALEAAATAQTAGPEAAALSGLVEGVEIVRRQFHSTLAQHGVEAIEARGAQFDPNVHDAISVVSVPDDDSHDRIVDVVKAGYRIGTEILRPVSVTVGKCPSKASSLR